MGYIIFTSLTEERTVILRGHPSHPKVHPLAVQRDRTTFISQLFIEDPESGTVSGIEPATSRSTVKLTLYRLS